MEPYYLPPSEYSHIIETIENRFGRYRYKPRVAIKPDLYKKYGALGQTTFVKTADGTPVLIEIDADVWQKPHLGLETLTHELLEWHAIEQGEEFSHFWAEQHTQEIFGQAARTIIDVFFANHPFLRRLVRGY